MDGEHESAIGAAVVETVADAAAEAVDVIEREAQLSDAAERVEDAAERVEDAAAAHENPAPDVGAIVAEHIAPLHARLDGIESQLNPAPPVVVHAADEISGDDGPVGDAPEPEEIADAVVEEIIERADDATDDLEDAAPDDLGDGAEIADVVPDVGDAAEVVEDTPPRKTHWMERSLFGRKG